MQHLIIGGGIAGTSCAEELRKLDVDADIKIICEESHPIYSRVLLPHYVKGKVPRERVFLKPADWYERSNIEWLPGVRAEKLDASNKFVLCSDGREYSYDKLLIATGGEVKTVLEDHRGVSYFRTLDDADHLIQLLRELPVSSRAAVFGGGFIACEYLNIFAQQHISTTLALRGPYLWSRTLDAESGTLLNERLRAHDVEVLSDTVFESLEGNGYLSGFRTNQGSHSCAILGVGIGIQPEFHIVREAGIEVNKGIRTNEYLQTNIPDVYAAGDAAEFLDCVVGHHRVVGNWLNAMMHGRVAAKNMAGVPTPFRLVSSYATNVLGLEVIFVGEADREHSDEVRMFGSAKDGGVTQVFLKEGKAMGATIIGRNLDRAPITKAIDSQEMFVGF